MPRYRSAAGAALPFVLLAVLAFVALLPGERGRAQEIVPANDNFDRPYLLEAPLSPLGVESGAFREQSTVNATLEAGESNPCADIGATVWFLFVAPATTAVEIDTAGSDFDTAVAIYHITDFVPSPPGGSLDTIACNNDDGASQQARLTADVQNGLVYAIQAGGVQGASGRLAISLGCSPSCPAPNDSIKFAVNVVELPYRDRPSTANITGLEQDEPQPCAGIDFTLWYKLSNSTEAPVTVDAFTSFSDFPTVLAVYGVFPSPPDTVQALQCVDSSAEDPDRAALTFTIPEYETYYLQAGGRNGATGTLDLQLTCPQGTCRLQPIIDSVDTGQRGGGEPNDGLGIPQPGGVRPPDTGNGGYLPGPR